MKKLITGRAGTGKTYIGVKKAIQNTKKNILLISLNEMISYLKLEDCGFTSCSINALPDIERVGNMQIILNEPYNSLRVEEKLAYSHFIRKHLNDENLMIIFDEGPYTLPTEVQVIFTKPDIKADIVLVSQSEECLRHGNKSLCYYDFKMNGWAVEYHFDRNITDLDFIIGEINEDKEAASFINATCTRHQCLASVHEINFQDNLNKLINFMKNPHYTGTSEFLELIDIIQNPSKYGYNNQISIINLLNILGIKVYKDDIKSAGIRTLMNVSTHGISRDITMIIDKNEPEDIMRYLLATELTRYYLNSDSNQYYNMTTVEQALFQDEALDELASMLLIPEAEFQKKLKEMPYIPDKKDPFWYSEAIRTLANYFKIPEKLIRDRLDK